MGQAMICELSPAQLSAMQNALQQTVPHNAGMEDLLDMAMPPENFIQQPLALEDGVMHYPGETTPLVADPAWLIAPDTDNQ